MGIAEAQPLLTAAIGFWVVGLREDRVPEKSVDDVSRWNDSAIFGQHGQKGTGSKPAPQHRERDDAPRG